MGLEEESLRGGKGKGEAMGHAFGAVGYRRGEGFQASREQRKRLGVNFEYQLRKPV